MRGWLGFYSICSAGGGGVNEGWQVGNGKTNYLQNCILRSLFPLVRVQEDGFDDTTVQEKQEVWFD